MQATLVRVDDRSPAKALVVGWAERAAFCDRPGRETNRADNQTQDSAEAYSSLYAVSALGIGFQ